MVVGALTPLFHAVNGEWTVVDTLLASLVVVLCIAAITAGQICFDSRSVWFGRWLRSSCRVQQAEIRHRAQLRRWLGLHVVAASALVMALGAAVSH